MIPLAGRFVIHPLNRGVRPIKIVIQSDMGKATGVEAGTTFYWDFSKSLTGKAPLDAIHFTQRISGTEFVAHALAATRALEEMVQASVPENVNRLRNILLSLEIIYGHITHFYQSVLPDYIPYPGAEHLSNTSADYRLTSELRETILNHVWRSLEIRRSIHQGMALLGGKIPHVAGLMLGGFTYQMSVNDLTALQSILKEVSDFINKEYTHDIYQLKKNYADAFNVGFNNKKLLTVGEFPRKEAKDYLWPGGIIIDGQTSKVDLTKISIDFSGSWYEPEPGVQAETPLDLRLKSLPDKPGGYSWVKGALYDKETYEVGALARMTALQNDNIIGLGAGAYSVMGRYRARLEECYILSAQLLEWAGQLKPQEKNIVKLKLPEQGKALGAAETAGGPVLHYVTLQAGKITNYNILDPLSWNLCPTTQQGQRGPLEQSLLELPVPNSGIPYIINRVARSF